MATNPNAAHVFGPAIADVWGFNTKKRKRKQMQRDDRTAAKHEGTFGGGRKDEKRLHPEVAAVAGEAHGELIAGNQERAIQLFGEVVRRAPDHPDAYATLSEVFEGRNDEGDAERALQLALVAAHLYEGDAEGWRRVAILALDASDPAPSPHRALTSVEDTARDALDRILTIDPADSAALGDLAQLLGRTGRHGEAADRCTAFLRARDGGTVSARQTALYLVLAEHCCEAERWAEAKMALKRALDDAGRLADAEDMRARAAVELARLKLREHDIAGARRLLGDESIDEPLDVSVLRGCCDGDPRKWAPLVPHLRRVAGEIPTSEEACRAHEWLATLVECCVCVEAGDVEADAVVRALIDGGARCAAARVGLKRPDAPLWRRREAAAHAALVVRFLARGSLYAASQRAERALKADATHLDALKAYADCVAAGADLALDGVALPFARCALTRGVASPLQELGAWVAYARALARQPSKSRAATLLAIAAARASTKLRSSATSPLAICAATVACGEDPLAALSAALARCKAEGAADDVFRRVELLCKKAPEISVEGTLHQCCAALDARDDRAKADNIVTSMAAVEACGLTIYDAGELAKLMSARGLSLTEGATLNLAREVARVGRGLHDKGTVDCLREALAAAEAADATQAVEIVDDALSNLCRRRGGASQPISALVASRQACQPRRSTGVNADSSDSDDDVKLVVRRAPGMKTCPGCQAKLHNCVKRCAACGATFGSKPAPRVQASDDEVQKPKDASDSEEGEACVPRTRRYRSESSSSSSSEAEAAPRPSRFSRARHKTQRLSDLVDAGKSYAPTQGPRPAVAPGVFRPLPSSDEYSSSDDESVRRRKPAAKQPPAPPVKKRGAPSKACPKCQTRMPSCKKKCPTCGKAFGGARAGGAYAARWKTIQSHRSGNTAADVEIQTVGELRESLASRGLSSEGLKKDLRTRLLAEYAKPPKSPAADAAAAAAADDARAAAPPPAPAAAASSDDEARRPKKKPAAKRPHAATKGCEVRRVGGAWRQFVSQTDAGGQFPGLTSTQISALVNENRDGKPRQPANAVRDTYEARDYVPAPTSAATDVVANEPAAKKPAKRPASGDEASAACAPRKASKPLAGTEDARTLVERAAPIRVRQDNPKKGASALRYAKYMAATTAKEYIALGGSRADLKNDINKGFVKVLVPAVAPAAAAAVAEATVLMPPPAPVSGGRLSPDPCPVAAPVAVPAAAPPPKKRSSSAVAAPPTSGDSSSDDDAPPAPAAPAAAEAPAATPFGPAAAPVAPAPAVEAPAADAPPVMAPATADGLASAAAEVAEAPFAAPVE